VVIEADLVSPGAPTSGAVVRLYEVERAGRRPVRRAIDEELLGHLEADRAYRVQVPYRPACGRRQEVELVVAEGHRTEARRTAIVHVPCERTVVCHGGRSLPVAGSAFAAHVRHGDPPGACVD